MKKTEIWQGAWHEMLQNPLCMKNISQKCGNNGVK